MKRLYRTILFIMLLAAVKYAPAQSSFDIGWNIPTPNKSGSLVSIRGKHNGKDSAWIINTETAEIVQRIPDRSFGIEMKLIRAGVYTAGRETFKRAAAKTSKENKKKTFDVTYKVYSRDDSLLATSTIGNSEYDQPATSYARVRPLTALIGRQEKNEYVIYDMRRQSGKYAAKVFALDTEKEQSPFHTIDISPNGKYVFMSYEYVMVDLEKGKSTWQVDKEHRSYQRPLAFSATSDSIAFPLKGDTVFMVREVRNDKTLYEISIANNADAKALGLPLFEAYPLPDMKHVLARYKIPGDQQHKTLWCIFAADGSYRRINF